MLQSVTVIDGVCDRHWTSVSELDTWINAKVSPFGSLLVGPSVRVCRVSRWVIRHAHLIHYLPRHLDNLANLANLNF